MSPFTLTCYFAQRDVVKPVENSFGVKEIKKARRRLRGLLKEEGRVVDGE